MYKKFTLCLTFTICFLLFIKINFAKSNNWSNSSECNVFPGDVNFDGIVNNIDISLNSFYQGMAGPPRYGNYCPDWGILQANGQDIKHHDCDGNGVIDENDQAVIIENLGISWQIPDPPPTPHDESDYQIMLRPIDQIIDGCIVMNLALESRLGGDLTLYGGHFTIDYSDVEGEFSFVDFTFFPITWLGNTNQNLYFNATYFPNDKIIEVGFTKTDNTNSSGSGIIGHLILGNDNCNGYVEPEITNNVYPGDLNHDGIVNNEDISLSGLFHSAIGSARTTEYQNIGWYAHPSEDWGVLNSYGVDLKHHDCNGDGIINETDTLAVRNNMGLTWKVPDPTPPAPPESDYLVMLNPIDQIFDGYLVINVALERREGGDLTILSGHFTIDYSDVEGDFGFVDLDFFPITWLGVPTQNLWFDTMHFPEEKKFEVGFTRNDNSDSSGSGVIAQLILEYSSLASRMGLADVSYQFKVNTIGVHNNSGEYTPIEDQLLQVNLNSVCEPYWIIDEDTPFQNKYQSSNDITTNGFVIIGEDQEVEYEANRVTLNSGFSIKVGENSQFRAGYGNCN